VDGKPSRSLITGGAIVGVAVLVTLILLIVFTRSGTDQDNVDTSPPGGVSAYNPPPAISTTDSPPDTYTDDTTTTDPADDSPAAVVQAYYNAVDARDYQTAWQLGGDNFDMSYSVFVNGYATTASDDLIVTDTNGDTVDIDLTAQWTDGSTHQFEGSYIVTNGQIVSGKLHKIS
jgi:hypothetical protein